jgi:hypothetical protein
MSIKSIILPINLSRPEQAVGVECGIYYIYYKE